jgi:hypothetical protein
MSGITSVRAGVDYPSKKGPFITIAVGAVFLFTAFIATADKSNGFIVGLPLIALGTWLWRGRRPQYSVLLHSASGEQKATTGTDKEFIQRTISALNQAIVMRG